MIKGFREFILRGNVIDLAVAVVIGGAFTALVKSIADNLMQPVINLALGGGVKAGKWHIADQVINVSAVINAFIAFLVTAAVVYFVFVAPMAALKKRRGDEAAAAPEPIPTDEVLVLREIRDLLRQGGTATPQD